MTDRIEKQFMAIVEETPIDPKAMPTYRVHVVNAADQALAGVSLISGGYTTDDDELLECTGQFRDLGPVSSSSSVLIGPEDQGSFDFVVWWTLEISFEDGRVVTQTFTLPKWFPLRLGSARRERVPVLDVDGWVVPPARG